MATTLLIGRSVNVLKLEGCTNKSLIWHPLHSAFVDRRENSSKIHFGFLP